MANTWWLLLALGSMACAGTAASSAAPSAAPTGASGSTGASARTGANADARAASLAGSSEEAGPGTAPASNATPGASCPEGMALLARAQGPYCIDRYEASLALEGSSGARIGWPGNRKIDGMQDQLFAVSLAGVKPQGYVSGQQAARTCANAGKRLCEVDEWVRACRGPALTRYPYGNERRPNLCNDRYNKLDHHPVVTLFKAHAPPASDPRGMWHPSWMNDPRLHEMSHSVFETGAFPSCTNDFGTYDMVGNLHEWIADESGIFLGGFFMDTFQNGEGCEYRTRAHPFDYHDYSTGFRCCADPSST